MIIYKDIWSGDELISDSYDLKEVHDGVAFEAEATMITIDAVNVDTGANASAEEADEALEDSASKVNNIVHSFNLVQQEGFPKDLYTAHLKKFFKQLKDQLKEKGLPDDEIDAIDKKHKALGMKIVKGFKDYDIYAGEHGDDGNEGGKVSQLAVLNYREDGVTPFFTFWKYGMKEEKV